MCMGGMHPRSGIIAALDEGDEVIIRKGFGHPQVKEDSIHIIASRSGFCALTTSGIRIICRDGIGVIVTGNHYSKFELNEESRRIINEIS